MDNYVFVIAVMLAVVVVAVVAVGWYVQRRRNGQLRAIAGQLGYAYTEREARDVEPMSAFPLFSQGSQRQFTNLLRTETDGVAVTYFDYSYTILGSTSGKHRNTKVVAQSVVLFESQRLALPAFTLRPEGLSQKLRGKLGEQDIDFPKHRDFSSAYMLKGADEAQVRALFDGEKLTFFAGRRGLFVEGEGNRLFIYREHKLVPPKGVQAFVEEGRAVLQLFSQRLAPAIQVE